MDAQSTTLTEREQLFLQKRVGNYGAVVGCCFGFFLSFRVTVLLIGGRADLLGDPSMVYHLLATLGFASAWLLCRTGKKTVPQVRAIETFSLMAGMVASALMGSHIPLDGRPEFVLLMALTYAILARAIWVPSTPRRSFALALLVGVDLVVGIYFMYATVDGVEFAKRAGVWEAEAHSPHAVGLLQAVYTGAWWILTIFVSTATSHVIYGLRRQVRDAKRLGQYQLEVKLGEGGMGVVYKAKHAMLQRPTAVKLMHSVLPEAAELRRFEHEVRQTARLSHPNVITIFDFGRTDEGIFYYAMEYIEGVNLTEVVEQYGPVSPARTVHILELICAALVAAHGQGLIHRDIKPANVMLYLPHEFGGVAEGVKLLDFGLVKEMKSEELGQTESEVVRGTPQYLAPESIRQPEMVDGRSDLYAVGAVGYYLLTGTHVFRGANLIEVCSHHLHTEPDPPSSRTASEIPRHLEALLLRCLAKKQAERPQSAGELQEALRSCAVGLDWSPEDARLWWQKWRTEKPAKRHLPPLGKTEIAIDLSLARRKAETSGTW